MNSQVSGACIEVHKRLGPGLLESIYHQCLARELAFRNILFLSEQRINVIYRDIELDTTLRADFLIEKSLIVEIKAVEAILPIHKAQILTYMKLLDIPKGLLINFNCTSIVLQGKKSFVNDLYRDQLKSQVTSGPLGCLNFLISMEGVNLTVRSGRGACVFL